MYKVIGKDRDSARCPFCQSTLLFVNGGERASCKDGKCSATTEFRANFYSPYIGFFIGKIWFAFYFVDEEFYIRSANINIKLNSIPNVDWSSKESIEKKLQSLLNFA